MQDKGAKEWPVDNVYFNGIDHFALLLPDPQCEREAGEGGRDWAPVGWPGAQGPQAFFVGPNMEKLKAAGDAFKEEVVIADCQAALEGIPLKVPPRRLATKPAAKAKAEAKGKAKAEAKAPAPKRAAAAHEAKPRNAPAVSLFAFF